MDHFEDDDDTHFCIKCHATITGLETYVRHRQSACCRPSEDKNVAPSTPTVSYPEILNADAFFSSLELQSSSKTASRREPDKKLVKRDDRRRRLRKNTTDAEETPCSKDKQQLNMLPVVADLDDPTELHLGIPSLVGFPDIVSSTSSKPPTKLSSTTSKIDAKHETMGTLDEGMIMSPGSKLQIERKGADTQEQNWLDDTILSDLVPSENKDLQHANLERYEFEYQQDEESEEESLEEDLDEYYSETDDPDDRRYPPRGHTGGKWKPGHLLNEEDGVEPEDDHPPPSHTGGKWKPLDVQKIEEDTSGAATPPAGHTRGKWIPGAQADINAGYWCNPCGRKLASRLVYNRHLLSDLHAKRSLQEIEGLFLLPQETSHRLLRKATKRQEALLAEKDDTPNESEERDNANKRLRKRDKEVISCEMCRARVRKAQIGKHLLSHYHCRVSGVNPATPKARRFLLENMGNVVRQCPFQCAPCKFYCNTEDTFLLHWKSALHLSKVQSIPGSYRCTPCDYWCEDDASIEEHLLSDHHKDVVAMMNGSVPVVVRRQRQLSCDTCNRAFRYNLQLRLHAKRTGHVGQTGSDQYQNVLTCEVCSQVLRSLVALQRHQLQHHVPRGVETDPDAITRQQTNPYYCSFCSMNFASSDEAIRHRRTSGHKEVVRSRKTIGTRDCPHCDEKLPSLGCLKEHLLRSHTQLCHRCPQCGAVFALAQDVTRHTRGNECSGHVAKTDGGTRYQEVSNDSWRCSSCDFSTDLRAELVFHEALHAGSVSEAEQQGPSTSSDSGSREKYRCPLCDKLYPKVALRNHILSHTGERPFPCAKCRTPFSKRADLSAHWKICSSSESSWTETKRLKRSRSYVCAECDDAFYTKHALSQHMLRHAGKKYKCGLPGCPTILRTASELKTHRMLVHENQASSRRYQCQDCSYAAKTPTQLRRHRKRHENSESAKNDAAFHYCPHTGCGFRTKMSSHLKRHVRQHTNSKPYKCRHCSYASSNLENLRKHVLSTTLHPGKTIYECETCVAQNASDTYRTNFAKELRAHLLEVHPVEFPTPSHASSYIQSIFSDSSAATDAPPEPCVGRLSCA